MNTCIVIDHGKPSAIGNRNLIVESTRLFEKRFFSNSIKGTREMRGESTIVTSEIFSFPPFRASRRACCLCYMCLSKKKKNTCVTKRDEKKNSTRPIFATGNVKLFDTTHLFSLLVIDITSHRRIHQYAQSFHDILTRRQCRLP